MKHILHFIHEHCRNPQFDVNLLHQLLKYSDSYIREVAHKECGMSPCKIIEGFRLDKVIENLDTAENLIQLSIMCGFGSLKTFNRAFLKRVGISAASARKQLQESSDKENVKRVWRLKIWQSKAGILSALEHERTSPSSENDR